MADVPLCPSLVAVIVAEPAATPVTNPLAETVAAAALLVAQVTTRPLRAVPFASFGVAVNWVVVPTVTVAAAGLNVTEATGTLVTVRADVPLCPSLVAVIVAEPAATLSPFFRIPYTANCTLPPPTAEAVSGVRRTCAIGPLFFTCELPETVVLLAVAVGAEAAGT